MSNETERFAGVSPWSQLAAMFGTFIVGGVAGWALSSWAAPGSGLAAAVSGMLLPLAFVAALLIWGGLNAMWMLTEAVRRRESGNRRRSHSLGRFAIVPLSLVSASGGGVFIGLLPGGEGVLETTAVYALAGWFYGRATYWLARRGYIPGPHLEPG